jgi:nitric oxide reductase subunit B
MRLPGDVLIIVGGVLPLLWLAIQGVLSRGRRPQPLTEEDLQLFTEVTPAPEEAGAR